MTLTDYTAIFCISKLSQGHILPHVGFKFRLKGFFPSFSRHFQTDTIFFTISLRGHLYVTVEWNLYISWTQREIMGDNSYKQTRVRFVGYVIGIKQRLHQRSQPILPLLALNSGFIKGLNLSFHSQQCGPNPLCACASFCLTCTQETGRVI